MRSLIQGKAFEIIIFTYFIIYNIFYKGNRSIFLIVINEMLYDNFKCLTVKVRHQFYIK